MTSFCWCGRRMVLVSRQMVLDGLTVSCGKGCDRDHAFPPTQDVSLTRKEYLQAQKVG